MLSQDQYLHILHTLPFIRRASPQLAHEFQDGVFFVQISAGKDVFVEGDLPDGIALVISGVVRVYKIGETGREITLYRFGHGESCILTANAILSNQSFPAVATVEKDVKAIMIPADTFRDWVKRHDLWREFVFELLANRLSTVLAVVDEVVFKRMDRRVASLLLNKSTQQHPILVTHQQIAADLGSSREVISRILEDFSQEGLIESRRGVIRVINLQGLESRAVM